MCSRTSGMGPITTRAFRRSALPSRPGPTITYKILYNDAVAMTGGQHNEGDLDAPRIVAELGAMGVKNIAVVYDEKEDVDPAAFQGCANASSVPSCKRFSRISPSTKASAPSSISRPAPPKNAAAASAGCFPTPTSACSSTPMSAKAVVIAGCNPTAYPSFRQRRNWGASARLINRPATRIFPA